MRLLHRYRVVRLGGSPKYDVTLYSTLVLRRARRRYAAERLSGRRDVGIFDALTGRFV